MEINKYITLALLASAAVATVAQGLTVEDVAVKTRATQNNAPSWTKPGAYVYRVTTPDSAEMLRPLGEGIGITANLLDKTVQQIPLVNGLIGHDHPGPLNWDGLWPYWGRATFRTGGWDNLRDFMVMINRDYNAKLSFHVNVTDVNVGLRDYPESRAFFQKLVATKSIYRRDRNPKTNKRDLDPPYVPQDIDSYIGNKDNPNPIEIFALVNYKQFWDSGLAKEMFDDFYDKLPYAPPVLYVDVLTASGGNFSTGYPDGPLGGSKKTQIEGVQDIGAYLRSKGTDIGMEGNQLATVGKYGTYSWLHASPGYSRDDYSVILGAAKGPRVVYQHVFGNTGSFVVSAVGCTPEQITKVRAHYQELLAGQPITREMPGLKTWHISDRGRANDEFNMSIGGAGGGDPFRGDWIDLVNNFYLTGIQELYHIGKENYRTASFQPIGTINLSQFGIIDPSGHETVIPVTDILPDDLSDHYRKLIQRLGYTQFDRSLTLKYNALQAGEYKVKIYGGTSGPQEGAMNLYVNQALQSTAYKIAFPAGNGSKDIMQAFDLGVLKLAQGENEITVDAGPVYSEWSDGTKALWTTPSLGTGFTVTNGDLTYAIDYDRMWPDTWSGQKKIYFFSWDGTDRTWKLPADWRDLKHVTLYPLTPDGRGKGVVLPVQNGSVSPRLLPQVPGVLVPDSQ